MSFMRRGNKDGGGDDPKKPDKPAAGKKDDKGEGSSSGRGLFGRGGGSGGSSDKPEESSGGRRIFGRGSEQDDRSKGGGTPSQRPPGGGGSPGSKDQESKGSPFGGSGGGRSLFGRGGGGDEGDKPGARPGSGEAGGGGRSLFGRGGGGESDKPGGRAGESGGGRSPLGRGGSDRDEDKSGPRSTFGASRTPFGRSGGDSDEESDKPVGRTLGGGGGSGGDSGGRSAFSRPGGSSDSDEDKSGPRSSFGGGGRSAFSSSRGGDDDDDDEKPAPRPFGGGGRPGGGDTSSGRSPLGGGSGSPGGRSFGGGGSDSAASSSPGRSSFSRPASGDDDDDEKPAPRPFGGGGSPGGRAPGGESSSGRSPLGGGGGSPGGRSFGGGGSDSSTSSSPGRSSFSRPGSGDNDDDEKPAPRPFGGGSSPGGRAPGGDSSPGRSPLGSSGGGSSPGGRTFGSGSSDSSTSSPPGRSTFGRPGASDDDEKPSPRPFGGGSSPGGRAPGGGSGSSGPGGRSPGGASDSSAGSPSRSTFGRPGGSPTTEKKGEEKSGGRGLFGRSSSPSESSSSPARPGASSTPGRTTGTFGAAAGTGASASAAAPATERRGLFGRGKADDKPDQPAKPKGKAAQDEKAGGRGLFGFGRGSKTDDPKAASRGKEPPRPAAQAPARATSKAKPLPSEAKIPRNVTQGLSLDRKLDLLGGALIFGALVMVMGWLQVNLSSTEAQGGTAEIDIFMAQLFGIGRIMWAPVLAALGGWLLYRHFGRMFDIDFFRIAGYILLYLAFLTTLHWWSLFFNDFPNQVNFVPTKEVLAQQSRALYEQGSGGGFFGHVMYIFLHRQFGDWVFEILLFFWWVLGLFLAFDLSVEKIADGMIARRNARQLYEAVDVSRPVPAAAMAAAAVATAPIAEETPGRRRGAAPAAPEQAPAASTASSRTAAPSDAPVTAATDGDAPVREKRGLFGRRQAPSNAPITADTDGAAPERASRNIFGRRTAPAPVEATQATAPSSPTQSQPTAGERPADAVASVVATSQDAQPEAAKRRGIFGRGGRTEAPTTTVTPETDDGQGKRGGLFNRTGRQTTTEGTPAATATSPDTAKVEEQPQRGSLLGRSGRRVEPTEQPAASVEVPAPATAETPSTAEAQPQRAGMFNRPGRRPETAETAGTPTVTGEAAAIPGETPPAEAQPQRAGMFNRPGRRPETAETAGSPTATGEATAIPGETPPIEAQSQRAGMFNRPGRRPETAENAEAENQTPAETPRREPGGLMGRRAAPPADAESSDEASASDVLAAASMIATGAAQRDVSASPARFAPKSPAESTGEASAITADSESSAPPQREPGLMSRMGRRAPGAETTDEASDDAEITGERPAMSQREPGLLSRMGRQAPGAETTDEASDDIERRGERPAMPQREPGLLSRMGRQPAPDSTSESPAVSQPDSSALAEGAALAASMAAAALPIAADLLQPETSSESPAESRPETPLVTPEPPARPTGLLSRLERRAPSALDEDTLPNITMETKEFRREPSLMARTERPSSPSDTSEKLSDDTPALPPQPPIQAVASEPEAASPIAASPETSEPAKSGEDGDAAISALSEPPARPSGLFTRNAGTPPTEPVFRRRPSFDQPPPTSLPGRRPGSLFNDLATQLDETPAESVEAAAPLAEAETQNKLTQDAENAIVGAALAQSGVVAEPASDDEALPPPARPRHINMFDDAAQRDVAEEKPLEVEAAPAEAHEDAVTLPPARPRLLGSTPDEEPAADNGKETAPAAALEATEAEPDTPATPEEKVAPPVTAAKAESPPIRVKSGNGQEPLESLSVAQSSDEKLAASSGRWGTPDFRELLEGGSDQDIDHQYLLDRARVIEDTLESFGAPARVVEVNTGPVITQFGVEPNYLEKRGGGRTRVKVSAIAALDRDLALALAAKSIRIEAPVPGKGYVGIEVPNAQAALVSLRDVMASEQHQKLVAKSKLTIGLGKRVDGGAVSADLTQMPHLLIAGATGSGKSVCVNAIIGCLLLQNTPDEMQFIMVDPKRVELTGYNGIPHLVAPVVVDLERIVGVLKWVQREMDDRYKRFAASGARNILDFNTKLAPGQPQLPYLVVVVDELADLMMLAPEETERLIARLAQMARATGIHLIISTQRPSVDVVTGLIKANFPARIAFAVASSVDSRVILDQPGAEKLLGRGDMLYQAPDAPAPLRMQGVYVSDPELNQITHYWKSAQSLARKGRPVIPPGLASKLGPDETPPLPQVVSRAERLGVDSESRPRISTMQPNRPTDFWQQVREAEAEDDEDDDDDGDGEGDDLYNEAVELVRQRRKASISMLQRQFRIGYTRAARLIDLMEENGVVGPATEGGAKPRDVIID